MSTFHSVFRYQRRPMFYGYTRRLVRLLFSYLCKLVLLCQCVSASAESIVIDGIFDEISWLSATQYNTFYQVVPATLRETQDKVQVKAFANEQGVYVGIVNYQPKGQRQKQYNLQDAFMQADFNVVMLDFAGDGSAAYLFSMTLGGGIQDGAMTPQLTIDYDWDGVWQVAHAETDQYWTSEFFLPWSSVSFRPRLNQQNLAKIGVSVQLYDLAKNHVYGSQPQSRAHSEFYLNMPKVAWSVPVSTQWSFMPYLTNQWDGIDGQSEQNIGFDLQIKPSNHQKISMAVNPDFGQVDSDELTLNYTNVETLRTDKRAFFTEDLSLFSVLSLRDTKMIHTRRIGAGSDDGLEHITPIDWALRATHQGESVNVGAFAVKEASLSQEIGKSFYVLRSTFRSEQWQTGLLATHTVRPGLARDASTLTWDAQYQSATWSWQAALIQTEIDDALGILEQGNQTTAASSSGHAFLAAGKYQFTPRLDLGFETLRMDDGFDNTDLGYRQRANWRYHALIGNYAQSSAMSWLSRVKHQVTLSAQSDDQGQQLASQQSYLLSLLLDSGAQVETQLIYSLSGYQDNIGYQSEAFLLPASWSRRLLYISPYVGQFSFAASVQFDDEGIDGTARQFGVDLTWLPHANWTLNFNNFYRVGDGWLVANQQNQISSYDRELFVSTLKAAGLLAEQLELSFDLQWAVLEAETDSVLLIHHWRLQQSQWQDTSFVDHRFNAQFKLRYKLAPSSDVYLVYNRAGDLFGEKTNEQAWFAILADQWQQPKQDLWTIKIRYAF